MNFRTIPVLGSEISLSIVRKYMITMKKNEKFWKRTIFGYTGINDGCNAKNQTKKVEKASAH